MKYKVKLIANALDVTTRQIQKDIKKGNLKAKKHINEQGQPYYIEEEDFINYLDWRIENIAKIKKSITDKFIKKND
jgi:predicted transcriptional regulator